MKSKSLRDMKLMIAQVSSVTAPVVNDMNSSMFGSSDGVTSDYSFWETISAESLETHSTETLCVRARFLLCVRVGTFSILLCVRVKFDYVFGVIESQTNQK